MRSNGPGVRVLAALNPGRVDLTTAECADQGAGLSKVGYFGLAA